MKARVFACLFVLLGGCTLPGVGSQAVSRTSPPLKPVGTYSLRGDPNFNVNQLSGEMRLWHNRLWNGIEYLNETDSWLNPERLALSGDLYKLGRQLNAHITSLLLALRVTKDLTLLDEVDRLMELARTELKDYNADGFRNWRYLNDNGGSLYNDDYHEMDEILTHSLVAAVAAALEENAAFSELYAERAAFWTDYLENDFEAKWRGRNDVPSGFPFVEKDLMHPYVQFIRYHFYMHKLTGDAAYQREAERMAQLVTQQVRRVYTPGGPAYVWNHRFLPDSDGDALSCQPFVYLQITFQAFEDMAMEGFSIFDDAFMQRVATVMTTLVMKDGYRSFASDVCGGVFQAGFFPSSGDNGVIYHFMNFPFAEVGKWDATGKLERTVERAYNEVDLEDDHFPRGQANLSAAMLFLLADDPDGQHPN